MAPANKHKRRKLLSSSRPIISKSGGGGGGGGSTGTKSLSSRTTQSIISTHHTLHKRLAQVRKGKGDGAAAAEEVAALEAAIEANGGLAQYQRASVLGQSRQRGGDTSRVLVDWLDLGRHDKNADDVRILEVGALSATNAISRAAGRAAVRRIDLHSQDARNIEQADFMLLPPEHMYDVVSLSLVVNYVGDPAARGHMLRHTVGFLRHRKQNGLLPALFLVLPRPCVDNSRYLCEERLAAIMRALGYAQTRVKRSPRLYYSLWSLSSSSSSTDDDDGEKEFRKVQVRSGNDRNNFCIVLTAESTTSTATE